MPDRDVFHRFLSEGRRAKGELAMVCEREKISYSQTTIQAYLAMVCEWEKMKPNTAWPNYICEPKRATTNMVRQVEMCRLTRPPDEAREETERERQNQSVFGQWL